MTKRDKIIINYRPLGRHKALGLAWIDSNLIEIDSRLKDEELLYIIHHELVHMYYPDMNEEDVIDFSSFLSLNVWPELERIKNARTTK